MANFLILLLSSLCALMAFGQPNRVKLSRQEFFPPHEKYALVARYIIHRTDWASVATISTQDEIKGFPFVSLKSFCDGPKDNSTGMPYFYMTSMDVSGRDIEANNNVTIMASLAEIEECVKHNYDPQDPRCPKVMISGKFLKVGQSTDEYVFAKDALFSRHPEMSWWPKNHEFYVGKINPERIGVLDFFGGIKYVTPKAYFNVNITNTVNYYSSLQRVSVVEHKE